VVLDERADTQDHVLERDDYRPSPARVKSLYFRPRRELGQTVLLEPAHAIPSDVQGLDDLLDRLRLSVGDDAKAKLEHGSLIFGKLNKRLAERFSFENELDFFLWPGLLRRHQLSEGGLFISDRLVEARNSTSRLLDRYDLLDGEAGREGDLRGPRLTMKPPGELSFGQTDPVRPLNQVDRQSDRPRRVVVAPLDRLSDPPAGVG
jgi:hypothetical protein